MKSKTSDAILINKINFLESDRILNLITPSFGKITLIAKGSRKITSKLAGSIELFTLIKITYLEGKNEIGTLISASIIENYDNISKDFDRSQLAFHVLKLTNLNIHENPEQSYFDLLLKFLKLLNRKDIKPLTIKNWYYAQFLLISGNIPNLNTDEENKALSEDQEYDFEYLKMGFTRGSSYNKNHIKYLRLLFSADKNLKVFQLNINDKLDFDIFETLEIMFKSHLSL